jgi:hypothetical protein
MMRTWPMRRWVVAGLTALATVLVVGIPTVLIPNPVFGRDVEVTWWAWPALIVTAVLSGLITATYVRSPYDPPKDTTSRWGIAGGLLAYFAVGCPVCNKLVLIALGYTGALQWFAPVQPFLAVGGIVLLAWALRARLRGERSCSVSLPSLDREEEVSA